MFLVVIALAAVGYAAVATYHQLRLEGASTPSGGTYIWQSDHTDSFYVDTFVSDTLDVSQAAQVATLAELTTFTECDSCNDSIILIVQTLTAFNGSAAHIIHTDTFGTDGTLTDGEELQWHFASDTLLYNKLWFRTIMSDSVVTDADSTCDSTFIDLKYHVVQRPY